MEPMDTIFSSKYILPFSIVAVALVVVIGAAFISNQSSEPQPTPSPNPTLQSSIDGSEFEVQKLFDAGGRYGVDTLLWSPDGSMLAYTTGGGGAYGISIYSLISPDRGAYAPNTYSLFPIWSPDGKMLAYTSPDGGEAIEGMIEDGKPVLKSGIWIMNADGSGAKRLTAPNTIAGSPAWSPDGKEIIFAMGASFNNPFDPLQIWIMDKDGNNQRKLTNDSPNKGAPQFSPDGKIILYLATESELPHTSSAVYDLWVMKAGGSGQKQITDLEYPRSIGVYSWSPQRSEVMFEESGEIWFGKPENKEFQKIAEGASPTFSPDGIKIAYLGGGLWIMNSDGSNKMQLVESLERGPTGPLSWSPDGKRILFINNFTEVWSIDLAQ